MSGSSVAHGSQQWWWISTGGGDSVAPASPSPSHGSDSVAYGDWSRRCVSSSPIHIYICEKENDTGDEQAREMRNKVMKLMVVNGKAEAFFQLFTLTASLEAQFQM
ncbi:hypothetical protein F2Q69_00029059 [Brassica cretica]|uniref:Uncharacterized protein n=1 Tax=Brassica cretica TaxID=69181 RepID=A0A8S9S3R4_BRACR|nr:hypothetical protein F2Q69_00029059 [Brassica cretica]